MQVCPTYNHATPLEWYLKRVKYLKNTPKTIESARKAAADMENKINIGILYQDKKSVNYLGRLNNRVGVSTAPVDEVKKYDIKELLKQFG